MGLVVDWILAIETLETYQGMAANTLPRRNALTSGRVWWQGVLNGHGSRRVCDAIATGLDSRCRSGLHHLLDWNLFINTKRVKTNREHCGRALETYAQKQYHALYTNLLSLRVVPQRAFTQVQEEAHSLNRPWGSDGCRPIRSHTLRIMVQVRSTVLGVRLLVPRHLSTNVLGASGRTTESLISLVLLWPILVAGSKQVFEEPGAMGDDGGIYGLAGSKIAARGKDGISLRKIRKVSLPSTFV